MSSRRCGSTILVALLVGGVAACAAATPSPPTASQVTGPAASVPPTPSASPTPSDRPQRTSPNRLDVDVAQVDASWLWPLLDFASDGSGIIYSSGVLDGPAGDGAPDLWRYVPGKAGPDLLWRNPDRDRQLSEIGGDTDLWAFAEISTLGQRWWKLWVLTEAGGEPILLDAHPGDEDIPSVVPTIDVDAGRVAWSSFDRGPAGAVSQLWIAQAPTWEPRLLAEADASERAYWLPSLRGDRMAYVEVLLAEDSSNDIRHVLLRDLATPESEPRQLDTSGNATMPILLDDSVIWKEPDTGFAMFNWGRLFRYSLETEQVTMIRVAPQDYVNYPSAGSRFVAMWGANSAKFSIYDLDQQISRPIASFDQPSEGILRPHVAGNLLVWLHSQDDGAGNGPPPPIEYAWLPASGEDDASEP